MWQDRKYWAKNDEMFLGDKRRGSNPPEQFRGEYHKIQKKDQACEKALTRKLIDPEDRCKTKK
jgi:hypothetical protein